MGSAARASLIVSFAAVGGVLGTAAPARADAYQLTDIVTDDNANLTALGFAPATKEDSNFVNPWGVSFSPTTSPFWISDNGTGLTSLYRATGMQVTRLRR